MSRNLTKIQLSVLAEKVLEGTASAEEQEILNNWYHDFDDREALLVTSDNKEDLHQRLYSKINADINLNKDKRASSLKWQLAAMISLLIISIVSVRYFTEATNTTADAELAQVNPLNTITKTAEFGQRRSIQLPDGSHVKLNAGSSIQYMEDFSDGLRSVVLDGEAFFEVTRDESKPFSIQTNHIKVEVLGTSFNVKSYEDDEFTDVAVKTGRVLVKKLASSDVLDLRPNEMAVFNNTSADLIKQKIENEERMFGWIEGNLVFDNEDFDTAIKMISRWYGVEFKMNTVQSWDKRITANLTNSTLTEVLESLSHTYKLQYEIKGKEIMIK